MNEFIAWDKDKKYFLTEWEKDKITLKIVRDCIALGDMARYTFHDYIEKKDINNKKIYAEKSIFEFDLVELNIADEETGVRNKYNGYFKYDIDTLSYVIFFDRGNKFLDRIVYCPSRIQNIKTVDTIQENKLGLIK